MNVVTEGYIVSVLEHREEKEADIRDKMQLCVEEIRKVDSDSYKGEVMRHLSLSGGGYDSVKISRTNSHADTYHILERYHQRKSADLKKYEYMLQQLTDEILLMDRIWRVYIGLKFELFQILKLRWVEKQKWEVIARELGVSNRQISERLKMALAAIQYELAHGEGSSRGEGFANDPVYRKIMNVKAKKQDKALPGQMELPVFGKEEGDTKW